MALDPDDHTNAQYPCSKRMDYGYTGCKCNNSNVLSKGYYDCSLCGNVSKNVCQDCEYQKAEVRRNGRWFSKLNQYHAFIMEAQLIRFALNHPDAVAPVKSHANDAGFDLTSVETRILMPGEWAAINTGVILELTPGLEAQIRSRSGLAAKNGIAVLNSPGTVDADYRNEIKVILINHSKSHFLIEAGDRIAQMVIAPVLPVKLFLATKADIDFNTERGENGFGSTGK